MDIGRQSSLPSSSSLPSLQRAQPSLLPRSSLSEQTLLPQRPRGVRFEQTLLPPRARVSRVAIDRLPFVDSETFERTTHRLECIDLEQSRLLARAAELSGAAAASMRLSTLHAEEHEAANARRAEEALRLPTLARRHRLHAAYSKASRQPSLQAYPGDSHPGPKRPTERARGVRKAEEAEMEDALSRFGWHDAETAAAQLAEWRHKSRGPPKLRRAPENLEALRDALARRRLRAVDIYRACERVGLNHDGSVSSDCFRAALPPLLSLGAVASTAALDSIFDSIDVRGVGWIHFEALQEALTPPHATASRVPSMDDDGGAATAADVRKAGTRQQRGAGKRARATCQP